MSNLETITAAVERAEITLLPSRGGVVAAARFSNGTQTHQVFDGYASPDDEVAAAWSKGHFLLPFPNRLDGGRYTFEGKTYQFPINEHEGRHNLHGFPKPLMMRLLSQQSIDNHLVTVLKGSFEGTDYFPFPFDLYLEYALSETGLSITTRLQNCGATPMPIGLGWHPYFQLDTATVDELSLQLIACDRVEIDARMMPTGEKTPFRTFEHQNIIGKTQFDHCFFIKNQGFGSSTKQIIATLKSTTLQLDFWQMVGEGACNYFQLFIPEHRNSIAIEPMTCNVNAFNNGEGLQTLASKAVLQTSFGFNVRF